MSDQDGRLTWKEACKLLGCGKTFLYELIWRGDLQAYGVGRRNRFILRSDCEKLLAGKNADQIEKKVDVL